MIVIVIIMLIISLTYSLPNKDVMYDGGSTEHDPHPDDYRCNNGGGLIEMEEREEDDA